MDDALPLLYQNGYLAIPNNEVRVGIVDGSIPTYTGLSNNRVRDGGKNPLKAFRSGFRLLLNSISRRFPLLFFSSFSPHEEKMGRKTGVKNVSKRSFDGD